MNVTADLFVWDGNRLYHLNGRYRGHLNRTMVAEYEPNAARIVHGYTPGRGANGWVRVEGLSELEMREWLLTETKRAMAEGEHYGSVAWTMDQFKKRLTEQRGTRNDG